MQYSKFFHLPNRLFTSKLLLILLISVNAFMGSGSSCNGSNHSVATQVSYPEFFVCNYWEDTNQDGLLNVQECVGIKYSFRSFECITFVGRLFGKRPQKLSYKICTADFRNVKDGGVTIMYDNYCFISTFKPYELHNIGGGGVYKIIWYLNNNIVNITEFELRS